MQIGVTVTKTEVRAEAGQGPGTTASTKYVVLADKLGVTKVGPV